MTAREPTAAASVGAPAIARVAGWVAALSMVAGVAIVAASQPAFAADLPYAESFTGVNGAAWPAPWFPATGLVTVSDLQSGRGRLNGVPGNVARMILPGYAAVNVEAEVTFEFENHVGQGIGFYVRQNGGSLQAYLPHGQGYAMFLKGPWAWPEDLGIWREIDGVETQFAQGYNPVAGGLANGVRYRLRFRVTQPDPDTTLLQARVWPEGDAEPAAWTLETTDTHPLLQNTAGSFAIDIYNHFGTSPVYLDDISIRPYPEVTSVPAAVSAPGLALALPRPHPVTARAVLEMSAAHASLAELRVFDTSGRLLARPFAGAISAGKTPLVWRAEDAAGRRLSPGVYFLSLEAGAERVTRRVVVAD
jgi:hypothetical protein